MDIFNKTVLIRIDADRVVKIDNQEFLVVDEEQMQTFLNVRTTMPRANRELQAAVLRIITDNPGVSRSDIVLKLEDEHKGALTDRQLSLVLTNLRRGGHITNEGSRPAPKWFANT